jgi:hypothetical protein
VKLGNARRFLVTAIFTTHRGHGTTAQRAAAVWAMLFRIAAQPSGWGKRLVDSDFGDEGGMEGNVSESSVGKAAV